MKQINVKISIQQAIIIVLLALVLIQVRNLNKYLENPIVEVQTYTEDKAIIESIPEEPDTAVLDTIER